ncbi:MAG: tRNA threonylcarbamoyladenosine biosynthesis protein TsaE [Acidobacteriota bacterium]|nr:tRNA threonylcarbamoyladenosine biosynthesis protein TsaE [Acidobacteriota bacterium]
MRVWRSASVAETHAVGVGLAGELQPRGCLLLYGALGAGKTVLAQGVAEGLGIDPREVQSPTFALLREHELPGGEGARLAHLDLYRLSPGEAAACGFEEVLLGPGVKIVEWAERLPFVVPGALALTLREAASGRREIAELDRQPEPASDRDAGV